MNWDHSKEQKFCTIPIRISFFLLHSECNRNEHIVNKTEVSEKYVHFIKNRSRQKYENKVVGKWFRKIDYTNERLEQKIRNTSGHRITYTNPAKYLGKKLSAKLRWTPVGERKLKIKENEQANFVLIELL